MEKRKAEKYVINHINTERYKNSAIPSMIKMLNKEELQMKDVLKNISVNLKKVLFLELFF